MPFIQGFMGGLGYGLGLLAAYGAFKLVEWRGWWYGDRK